MAGPLAPSLGSAQHRDPTPGQTIGPFFSFGTVYPKMHEIVHPFSPGAIVLGGTIYDGAGAPVPDALVEVWSADPRGTIPRGGGVLRRDDHTFTGFGRSATTDEGRFEFWVLNPGSVDDEAPFFAVTLFARGLPDKLHTRIYLPDDTARLAVDPLLSTLPAEERSSLIATRLPNGHLHHDIRLQGEEETVFVVY